MQPLSLACKPSIILTPMANLEKPRMSFPRIPVLAIGLLIAALLAVACSDDGEPETLRVEVGVVQSLSGSAGAIYGASVLRGIELAVEEINAADAGVTMTIALSDDGSSVATGTEAFRTLSGRSVTAIIGPTLSNVALEAMPIAQQAGVPVLGATTTAQGITEVGDYVFRVALTEAVVVPATVARVHDEAPITSAVLVLDSTDAFSRSSADAMRRGLEAIGGTLLAEVDISQTPLETRFAELHGQGLSTFLVTPLSDKSIELVKAIRGDGFEQTIVGGNSFNTPGMADAGAAIEGAYVGAAWNPGADNAVSRRFVEAYRTKYGSTPDLFAAQGYSSVYLLMDAVKRAGSIDRAAVRDALAGINGVETPLGSVTMSENREAEHSPVIQRFEGGQLVPLP